ncbi:MAG: nuclear transport factor 2 family protein [Myxococcota bacterium]
MIVKQGVEEWHRLVRKMSSEALDEVLAEDVVFHSPIVHTPQEGRALTKLYLMAAFNVLPGQDSSDAPDQETKEAEKTQSKFAYVREVVGEKDAVLEFQTEIDGITVNGVDMIRWNDDGKIIDFKVMIRPLKAIQKIHGQMAAMLDSMKGAAS